MEKIKRLETPEMSPQRPMGLDILDFLDSLEEFEIFSGLGFLKKEDWIYNQEDNRWNLNITNHG